MKFLIDMPLSPALAGWLRTQGHDAIHAAERALHRAPDRQLLEFAAAEQRTIVTADLDFPHLLALTGATEPGIILFRGGDWTGADVTARLREVLAALSVSEIKHSIITVERERIRRRALPIGS